MAVERHEVQAVLSVKDQGFSKAYLDAAAAMDRFNADLSTVAQELRNYASEATKVTTETKELTTGMEKAGSGSKKMEDGVSGAAQATGKLEDEASKAAKAADTLQEDVDQAATSADTMATSLDKAGSEAQEASRGLDEAGSAAQTATGNFDSAGSEAKGAGQEFSQTGDQADKMGDEFDKSGDEAISLGQAITQAESNTSKFKDTMMGMLAAQAVLGAIRKSWDLIKGSVDGALGRIDTMDQFYRTMTAMTGSTDEAAKTLARANEIVLGTPYGLDTAAKAVQDFVTRGLTVQEATDTFEAFGNAVSFYGKGTNEQLANVSDAIAKMRTKGTVEMEQLNRLFDSGINAVGMYAEATGMSAAAVQEALTGKMITSEQFINTVVDAMNTGTASFPKLTNAAREAGTSWEGTFANMRAATTRGVQSIVNNIENARKNAGLPGMKDAVSDFGRSTEKVLKKVGEVAGWVAENFEVLSAVVGAGLSTILAWTAVQRATAALDAFRASGKATGAIIEAITASKGASASVTAAYTAAIGSETAAEGIRAAAKAQNIALDATDLTQTSAGIALSGAQQAAILAETGAMTLKGTITALLSGQIGVATAAQWAWNAAITANPIGAIIVGIVALVGLVKVLGTALFKTSKEHKEANAQAEKQANTLEKLNDAAESTADGFRDVTSDLNATEKQSKNLSRTLIDLSKSGDKSEKTNRKMRMTARQLMEIYPELSIEIDETTNTIKGGTDALEAQIKAMEDTNRTAASMDYLSDLYKQQAQYNEEVATSKQLMFEMEESGHHYERHWTGIYKMTDEYKALKEQLPLAEENLKKVTSAIETQEEVVGELVEVEEEAIKSQEELMRSLEFVSEAYGVATTAIVDYADTHGEEMEDVAKEAAKYAEELGMSMDEIIAAALRDEESIEDWAEAKIAAYEKANEAFAEMKSFTLDGWSELEEGSSVSIEKYLENLNTKINATKNWSTNIVKLMKAGVSGGVLKELAKMGPEGHVQAQAWITELEKLNGGTFDSFEDLNDTARNKLEEIATTYEEGVAAAADAAETQMMVEDWYNYGTYPAEELIKGAKAKEQDVRESSEALFKANHKKFWDEENRKRWAWTAKEGAEGFEKEMILGTVGARTAADELLAAGEPTGRGALSSLYRQTGKDAAGALGSGLKQEEDAVMRARIALGGKATPTQAEINQLASEMRKYGANAGLSFHNGLQSYESRINSTASRMSSGVAGAVSRSLQIRSPSVVMTELGEETGAGFHLGFESKLRLINELATDFALAAVPDTTSPVREAVYEEEARTSKPMEIILKLGERSYRAFAEDISSENNRVLELREAYGV